MNSVTNGPFDSAHFWNTTSMWDLLSSVFQIEDLLTFSRVYFLFAHRINTVTAICATVKNIIFSVSTHPDEIIWGEKTTECF